MQNEHTIPQRRLHEITLLTAMLVTHVHCMTVRIKVLTMVPGSTA